MDEAWNASKAVGARVIACTQEDAAFLERIRDSYRTWDMEPRQAQARGEAVLALAFHSLLTDHAAAGTGVAQALGVITVDQVVDALRTRPLHELFAGVPDDLGEPDRGLLAELKALAYSQHGPTHLIWVRLAYRAREALRHYAASLPAARIGPAVRGVGEDGGEPTGTSGG